MAKILITGGSGLVGSALSDHLLNEGHEPVWLSRSAGNKRGIKIFKWDPLRDYIDKQAFENVEHIVHLAGAGILNKRWTTTYKNEIIYSRTKSSQLLFNYISEYQLNIKSFSGASAIGYYGTRNVDHAFTENDPPAKDFLSEVCTKWENSYEPLRQLGIKCTVLRTAVVLSNQGGALKAMLPLFKMGMGAALASGEQFMPWIHISDLIKIYHRSIFENSFSGTYNAVSGNDTNEQFSRKLAEALHKPFFLPNVPTAALKIALGERSFVFTEGAAVSNQKLKESGMKIEFDSLEKTFNDLL